MFLQSSQNKSTARETFKICFQNIPILVDSNIFLVFAYGDSNIEINEVFRYSIEMDLVFEYFGFYITGNFSDKRDIKVNSIRRATNDNLKLRATLVVTNNDTFDHLYDYK